MTGLRRSLSKCGAAPGHAHRELMLEEPERPSGRSPDDLDHRAPEPNTRDTCMAC